MPDVIIACGCRAMAVTSEGKPFCTTHMESQQMDFSKELLKERKAECECGKLVNSNISLAFFEYLPQSSKDRFYCGCKGWD